ncbi:hypothetical protein [Deefgea salmonis]|uniref:Uncharacterized protein n=1 Tax=Deefgea salmonis TaxID=2875502 RepID=A0ABS8BJ22_9NEIS|nr:hypothetical protein [Deefgea salmonis]MCB5195714.1 hypothetical protein [Deefgea salmonis]
MDTAVGVLSGFIEFPSIKRSHTPSMTARAAGKIDWTIDPLPYDPQPEIERRPKTKPRDTADLHFHAPVNTHSNVNSAVTQAFKLTFGVLELATKEALPLFQRQRLQHFCKPKNDFIGTIKPQKQK